MATSFNNQSQPWVQLPGYTYIEGIHQGTHSIVYRALQAETKCPVIIKVLRQEHPSFAELVQFRNQYTITQNLAITGIVQPLSLANDGHRYALVMEDVGSISLAQYASQRALTLADVLAIALQLADILHALHQHRIIHKDIKPANILIHPESKRVHLIDFSLASLLPKETQVIQSPNTLEGTLAYLAPEQTGRMNRGIDYRADFYGLGVTLYELLTGELPFQSNDPMELIHCHIAKPPSFEFGSRNTLRQEQSSTEVGNQKIGDRSQALGVRGQKLGVRSQEAEDRSEIQNSKLQISNSEFRIPNSLTDIVLKLMAKNAEDRYQSALGLKHDLQRCLSQWETFGQIEAFELGQEDRCDRFLIPEKLYGRDTEVQTLLDAFERVSQGTAELMLVAGFSGIGKTAVVNEVHKPITQQRGYFIKGKFDQFNRNIPFSAFVQAFRNLMGQLLGESDATLAAWQAKILAAVGQSGQVLIEVIPELEKIIGPQPAIPELSGIAAQNRFNLLFRKFIQLFTTSKHPLVIFLDDLQWADSASLSLFKLLIDEAENGYLLILGAYRDNEVFPNHPLVLTLDELKKKTAALQTLTLEPLSQSNIYQLVADTLRCQPNIAAPLVESVYQKTQGNPFFTHQFLQELHSNRYISFDKTSGAWQCDLSRVGELAITDNVVEFMVGRLRQLPSPTQEVLKLSACIGNQFDLQTLAVVCECSQAEAAANLWPSLQMGLVVPAHNTYKFLQGNLEDIASANVLTDRIKVTYRFLHDCVQKSAYTLIPQDKKGQIHYHLGQLLTREISSELQEARIFELVTHLNYGVEYISDQNFRNEIAQLNVKACQKAKRTIAYQAGYKYAVMGLSWLSSEAWERQYDLSLQLHNFAAEFAWLCGDLDAMNGYIETILQQSQSLLDKISAFCLQIQADTSQMKFVEALTTAQQVLEFLGVALPSSATRDDLLGMVSDIELMIADISIAGLADLPVMTIPSDIAIIQIISHIIPTAYICGSHLFPVTVILGVKLLIRAGNSPLSAYIYANYAYILCNYCQSIEKSEEFGQLALRLANEPDAKSVRPQVYVMLALYMQHRKSPLRETLDLAQQGYIFAQEVGNQEWAGYSAYAFCANGFASVQNLIELEEMTHNYCVSLVKSNQIASANWCQIYRQAILNLTNPSPQQQTIFFDNLDQEAIFLAELHKAEDLLGLYHFHLCKLIISYLFGDIEVAHQHALEARARLNVAQGIVGLPVFYFYDSLVLLSQLTKINPGSEEGVNKLQQVESNQNKLQKDWANYAPVNYQHKFDLVQAEKLGILGERWAALELYDEAIAGAKTHDYFQEEALANELAAKFYLAWGKDKVAAGYMQDAYYGYLRWSAKAKTNSLEQQYPHLLLSILRKSHSTDSLQTLESISEINLSIHSSVISTVINTNSQLDFAAVLKATQLLSEQIQLDELLTQLVQLMLQNSGADKLAVILPDGGNTWQVRAIATPEITKLLDESFTDYPHLPIQLIQYAKNTREIIAIDDLHTDLPIIDAYLQEHQPRSILCLPILYQGDLTGLLYLQNQAIAGVFSRDRILVLNFLCTQAAIALENARLFKEQQRSAVEIQIKNNFLKAQQESSLDGMLVIDANRQVSAYNQRFVSIWNIPKAVLETQDDQQLLAYVLDQLENPTEFLERVEYLYNHPKECSCDEITLKNQRFLERYSSPVRLPWGEYSGRIWYFRDISDRKQLEQEQARLMAVLEATPDFIGVANTQGEILWHNKPLRELRQDLGNPKDHRSIANCHPDWANKIIREEALPTAIQHGSWSGELALLDGAGNEIPVSQVIIAHKSASGEVVNFSTIMRDIRDRKAAEQELTLKQNHLEALLNNIPHIAWIKDAESRFIAVNQPLAQMLNCSPTDMIGKTDYDFSPAAIAHGYQQDDFQVLTSGQRKIVEERTRRGDGSWGWLETTKTPFRDAQGRLAGTVGIAADISDRKAAEKLLKMTQYGVHNSSDGIMWVTANARIIYANPAICKLLGYSEEELTALSIFDIDPDFPPENWESAWQATKAGQDGCILESRHRTKDGRLCPVEIVGNYFELDGIEYEFVRIRDISDRKQAERLLADYNCELERQVEERTRALQESQHELTDYIENAATSLHWVDANGIILWANQTELDFLGYSREEYIGQPIANFHADDEVIADILTRLSNNETLTNYEARLRCKDGSIRYVQINSNVFYRDGEFVHTRCFTTDITERKAAETALNDLVAGTAATTGEDFFPALVCHISAALEVPITLVTQFVDQELQSLAFVVDGELQPNFTYNLPETPCRDLVVDYSYHCPSNLSEHFPNHPHRARGVDSYLGVALRDRQGQVLGSLCIFDRQSLRDPEKARQILDVFGSRAAAELERQRTEKALQNLVAGTAINTRADFFPVLVRYLTQALGVSHALIAERIGEEEVTLAYFGEGQLLPVQSLPMLNTPCEEVYKHGTYYCELEPCQTCAELLKMGARSYLGVALKDRQGKAIGLLAIFHRRILTDPVHAEQILRIFAARAAAELERQRAENALQNLIAGTAAFTGPDFFNALVRHIAEALNASYAFVNEVIDSDHTRILAAWADGEYLSNEIVEARDTPCAIVLQEGSYYCGRNLMAQFPHHPLIASMGVESYQGIVLPDRQGRTIGMLCVLARQPMIDPDRSEQILRVFAARAAAELERQRAANALQNLIAGTAALTGPDFFNALVCHIAEALNASHAFVTEVVEADQLRFLAAWGDGQHLPTDVVDIEGTTCAIALQEGAYHCERNVIACFPQNPRLAPMGVESYMGVALQNRQGQSLGTLCIFSRQLIANPEHSQEILRVFAARAAAELERQQAEMVINQQFAAIEAAIDGISILQNGVYRYVNQAHLNLFGYQHADELVGQSWKRLYSPDEVRRFEQDILPLLAYGQGWQGEAIATRQDGSTFAQGVSLTLTEDGLLISVCRDISDLKQAQSLITHNALHDPLTGLPNRTLLLERLALAIQRAQRYENYRYAVLFLDLDRFKVINDSLGHVVGDQLLVAITQRLKTHLRQTDLVARLGGDEFLILLEDISNTEEVAQIAERILDDCQTPLNINGHQIFISTSIGIVLSEKDYQQATDLIRDADIAMYQAKTDGRNSYRFFDTEMHTEVLKRLILETDLRKAVDQQEFEIYYQPIIELSNRQLIGFEALVRWRHPTRDLIAPDEFIPVAEETGFIQLIDSWVLQQACQQIVDWQNRFPEFAALKISINLSAQDLGKANLIEEIDRVLANTGLRGESITLEITESLLIQDIDKIIDLFMQLTQRKIQISIDDFGTGYSSLSYLHRLPVHSLKVDRSFVSQMESKTRNYKVVSTIVGLGQQLGLTTIAEGIEAPQQLSLVQKLGCQFGQGYLFSPPLSTQDVEVFFSQGKDALGSY